VYAVALTGNGRAVSGSLDRTLRVWDLGSGDCLRTLEGHTGGVSTVALTGDGWAVSGSDDGTLRVWELDRGLCLAVFPCEYPFCSVAVTSRPPHIAVGGDEQGNVLFFRIENLDRA
jgi:WD40 repeat protein